MTITAATVSAALRRQGLNPLGSGTSRNREGVRVGRAATAGQVTVVVDLDQPTAEAQLTADVRAALTASGYAFENHEAADNIVTVTAAQPGTCGAALDPAHALGDHCTRPAGHPGPLHGEG